MGLVKNKKLNWLLSGIMLAVLVLLMVNLGPQPAESQNYYFLKGFAWFGANCTTDDCSGTTDPLGWMSMNCDQAEFATSECPDSDYQVQIEFDPGNPDNIIGQAWIGNYDEADNESEAQPIGWVDFDSGTPNFGIGLDYNHEVKLEGAPGNYYLTGWAQIISMEQETVAQNPSQGWIRFRCDNPAECPNSQYGVAVDDVTKEFSGYAWTGIPEESGLGFLDFSAVTYVEKPVLSVETDLDDAPDAENGDSYARLICGGVTVDDGEYVEFQFRPASSSDSFLPIAPADIGYNDGTGLLDRSYLDWSTSGIASQDYYLRCRICQQPGDCTDYSQTKELTIVHPCVDHDYCEDFTTTEFADLDASGNWDAANWYGEAGIDWGNSPGWSTADNTAPGFDNSQASVVSYGDRIYVLTDSNFYSYLPEVDKWLELDYNAGLLGGVQFSMLVAHDGMIYSFCGYREAAAIGAAYQYEIATDTWTVFDGGPINQERYYGQALYYDGNIYIIGGKDQSNNYYDDVDIYNILTDKWGTDSILHGRSNFALEEINGSFYIVGGECTGYNCADSMEYLLAGETEWQEDNLTEAVNRTWNSALLQGKILVADNDNSSNFKMIDPANFVVTNLNDQISNPRQSRTAYGFAELRNSLYIVSNDQDNQPVEYLEISYDDSSEVRSGTINTGGYNVKEVDFISAYDVGNGQGIEYYVSNNNGDDWIGPISEGESIDFTEHNGADNQLRWKAVIPTTGGEITPRVYKVVFDYNAVWEADIYGWGWIGSDTNDYIDGFGDTQGWVSLNCDNNFDAPASYTCRCDDLGLCAGASALPTDTHQYENYGVKAYLQHGGDSPFLGKMWIGDIDYYQESAGGSRCAGVCTGAAAGACLRDNDCPAGETCNSTEPDYSQCQATGYLQTNAIKSCQGGVDSYNICTQDPNLCTDGDTCQWEQPPGAAADWDPYQITVEEQDYFSYANAVEAGTNFNIEGWGRVLSLRQDGLNQSTPQTDWGWVRFRSSNLCIDQGDYDCSLQADPETYCINNHPGTTACDLPTGKCTNETSCTNPDDSDCGGLVCSSWCGSADDQCTTLFNPLTSTRPFLKGFAWSGGGTTVFDAGSAYDSSSGLGWIQFSPTLAEYKYFQTKWGDLYLKEGGQVEEIPTTENYHATYLIQTEDLTDLVGFSHSDFGEDEVYSGLDFLEESGEIYQNALGRLDYNGIINDGNSGFGPYGEVMVDEGLNNPLDNKIYYYSSDYTIDSPLTLQNGDKGSGLVVVNGDLNINADISYQAASGLTELRQLASIGWIVRGDINIDPNVTEVVGAFIALGNTDFDPESETCDNNFSPEPGYPGCGRIYTGVSNNSLTIYGLMMARYFSFQRGFIGSAEPAELILYDGRLLVNTPPGLQSFTQGLPVWQASVSY